MDVFAKELVGMVVACGLDLQEFLHKLEHDPDAATLMLREQLGKRLRFLQELIKKSEDEERALQAQLEKEATEETSAKLEKCRAFLSDARETEAIMRACYMYDAGSSDDPDPPSN